MGEPGVEVGTSRWDVPVRPTAGRNRALSHRASWFLGEARRLKAPERPAFAGRGRPIRLRSGFARTRAGRPYLAEGRSDVCTLATGGMAWGSLLAACAWVHGQEWEAFEAGLIACLHVLVGIFISLLTQTHGHR